jgi:hypothetical protein
LPLGTVGAEVKDLAALDAVCARQWRLALTLRYLLNVQPAAACSATAIILKHLFDTALRWARVSNLTSTLSAS